METSDNVVTELKKGAIIYNKKYEYTSIAIKPYNEEIPSTLYIDVPIKICDNFIIIPSK